MCARGRGTKARAEAVRGVMRTTVLMVCVLVAACGAPVSRVDGGAGGGLSLGGGFGGPGGGASSTGGGSAGGAVVTGGGSTS